MRKEYSDVIEVILSDEYARGYNDGVFAGANTNNTRDYEKGLHDAWKCARKIFAPVNKGGLSGRDVNLIFNNMEAPYNIFDNYSASEAIAKIKEYEENQKQSNDEIKVGDEIYSLDKNYKSVVTAIFDTCRGVTAVYFTQNGKLAGDLLENLHKTGRHFPQIAEVLKQMQEGNE